MKFILVKIIILILYTSCHTRRIRLWPPQIQEALLVTTPAPGSTPTPGPTPTPSPTSTPTIPPSSPPTGLSLQNPLTPNSEIDTPTIRVSGVTSGDIIRLFTDSSCTQQVGVQTSSGTTVDITTSTLTLGGHTFYANTETPGLSVSSCSTASVSYTVLQCPTGYVIVPENTTLGVSSFCVMQFEAKNDGSGNPVSLAAPFPWVEIAPIDAKAECQSLGSKYDLISNPEWMTIAHEIEKTDSNWSGSSVGSGQLNRGHSDDSPTSGLAVSNATDPYDGTGNNSTQGVGLGWEQKRTHTLSNGQIVWDIAGNVWDSVDWSLGGSLDSGPISCPNSWEELPDVSGLCAAMNAPDYLPNNPSGQPALLYNSNYGLGQFYGNNGGAALRGGHWFNQAFSGVYTLDLSQPPTGFYIGIGFRCVYRP